MTVIDVDSHFYEPFDWLTSIDPGLASEIPQMDKLTLVLTTAFGEVLSGLPPEHRPDPLTMLPPALRGAGGALTPEMLAKAEEAVVASVGGVPGGYEAGARLQHLDQQGIDIQFVLPTMAFNPISYLRREKPNLTPAMLRAYNRWACGTLAGATERLMPVFIVDTKTMGKDEVLAEMNSGRSAGSRSFVFWPSPVNGMSLAHPDFGWFWAAAADLGLMPMIHVGASRPMIDLGWLNNGRSFPSSLSTYFGQLHQIPELLLGELLAGGILHRHPNLRVLVCELGIDWFPTFVRRSDRMILNAKSAWKYPLRPSEYICRNVRVSPLGGDPTAEVIEQVGPDVVVFSSDYPHPEGGADAVSAFRTQLEGTLDAAALEGFFGATMEKDLML